MKLNQSGAVPLLVLIAIFGIVGLLTLSTYAPFKNNLFSTLFPKNESHAATSWAFEETWDDFGAPTAPIPYNNTNKFDIVISSNDTDGVMDGFIHDGSGTGVVEAGHGHDCSAPLGGTNIHKITNNFDELTHQQTVRPQLVFVCNRHLMTVQKSGYSLASIMPRQYFDFSGRTGTIEIDTNTYGFGREWFDLYLVPEQDMLMSMATSSEGGTLEQMPKNAVKISFRDAKPSMYFIENYNSSDTDTRFFRTGYSFKDAFPSDPSPNDPRVRRKFRFQVSQTSWKYQVQVDASINSAPEGTIETVDGIKYWTHSGNFPKPLSFTKPLIRLEHHAYNPTKDGIFGEPWSQYTQHWDNFRFDGPILPAHNAFEPGNHFVKLWGAAVGTVSAPVKINVNVPQADIKNARILGEVASSLNRGEVDFANNSHWRQFRINGGAWQDMTLVKNVDCGCDRTWSTFRNSISGVVSGENTIEFKYANRPPSKTWQPDGFNVKDIEIQIDPVGALLPSSTPFPSQSPLPSETPLPSLPPQPSPSPSPSPTPLPSGLITVDFNSIPTGPLTGQNPQGVLDWASNWIVSSAFGQFTTRSISFSGPTIAQSTVNIVPPNRTLSSIQAFNGGTTASNITLTCTGNPTRTQSVSPNTLATITTSWTNACSSITLSSSNSWDTNFDNLILSSLTSSSPAPSVTPSPTPAASAVKPGDIDGNNKVDIFDYNIILTNFGQTGANIPGDFDNNNRVDIFDLNTLLTNFGK